MWHCARVGNRYVTATDNGADPLIAGATAIGTAETFALINNSGGSVSLLARINNGYVVAENGGAAV